MSHDLLAMAISVLANSPVPKGDEFTLTWLVLRSHVERTLLPSKTSPFKKTSQRNEGIVREVEERGQIEL